MEGPHLRVDVASLHLVQLFVGQTGGFDEVARIVSRRKLRMSVGVLRVGRSGGQQAMLLRASSEYICFWRP